MLTNMDPIKIKVELPRAWYADEEGSVHEFSCAGYLDSEGRFFPHYICGFTLEERKLLQGTVQDVLCKELLQKEGYTIHQLTFVRTTEGEESSVEVRQRTYTTQEEWEASYKKEAPLLPNNLLPEIGKVPYFKKWVVKVLNEWYGQPVFQKRAKVVVADETCPAIKEQSTGEQVTAEPAKKIKKAFSKALPDPGNEVSKVVSDETSKETSKETFSVPVSIPAFIRVDDANSLLKAYGLNLMLVDGTITINKVPDKVPC